MSFRVSANSAEALLSLGKHRLPVSRTTSRTDGAAEAKKTPSNVAVNTPSNQSLRYRLSAFQDESLSVQKRISELQAAESGLRKIVSQLEDFEKRTEQPSDQELEMFLKSTEEFSFNGRQLFAGIDNPVQNDSSDIEPIVISVPPKPGSYTVSLIEKKQGSGQIVYTISLNEDINNKEKSIKTAVSPVNGLIEGVELYFEKKESFSASFVIEEKNSDKFPLPDLTRSAKKLIADPSNFKDNLQQFQLKLETSLNGVDQELKTQLERFQKVANIFENISAADIDDSSINLVKGNIAEISYALLNDTKKADMFQLTQNGEHIQELL